MASFALGMKKYAASAAKDMHQITRMTVVGVMNAVDRRSPVGDRELWAINNVNLMNREMYQLFREDSGKARVTTKTLNKKFPGLQPKGYVGGRFRANWQLGVGEMPKGELFQKSPPATDFPSGDQTIARNLRKIPAAAGGRIYYLVNNLPYGQPLEDGHSTQCPPGGMVKLTMMEFSQFVNAAVAGARK